MNVVGIMGLPFGVFSFERMSGRIISNLFLILNYSKIVIYNFGNLFIRSLPNSSRKIESEIMRFMMQS